MQKPVDTENVMLAARDIGLYWSIDPSAAETSGALVEPQQGISFVAGRHYVYGPPGVAPYDARIQFRPVCASDDETVAACAMDALLSRKIAAGWRRSDRAERNRLLQTGLGVPETQQPPHMTEKVLRFDRLMQ
jgi:hypothetical protein